MSLMKIARRRWVAGLVALVPISATFLPSTTVEAAESSVIAGASDGVAVGALHALMLMGDAGTAAAPWAVPPARYHDQRNVVAAAVAGRVGLDPDAMTMAWAVADLQHQRALLAGLSQLGVPYRKNTSQVGVGFDCSGLTTFAWGAAGFALARQSGTQIKQAAFRTLETAQAGDLMQYPGHVMMWLGVGRGVLQSPFPGRRVEVVLYRAGRSVKVGDPTG